MTAAESNGSTTQASAHVWSAATGFAMGGAGTDVALETADVALMGDDLSKLPFAVGLGRATRAIIMQNLFISLGVIALLIITSLTGIVSIGIAIYPDHGRTDDELLMAADTAMYAAKEQGEGAIMLFDPAAP